VSGVRSEAVAVVTVVTGATVMVDTGDGMPARARRAALLANLLLNCKNAASFAHDVRLTKFLAVVASDVDVGLLLHKRSPTLYCAWLDGRSGGLDGRAAQEFT
jgi:hypothetical protein